LIVFREGGFEHVARLAPIVLPRLFGSGIGRKRLSCRENIGELPFGL
jgi:hypothetical protein